MVTWLTNPTAIQFTKNYLKDEKVIILTMFNTNHSIRSKQLV